jgi:hypothetical protein
MRRIVTALCFSLAFAIPVCLGAVAFPFRASPSIDPGSSFRLFCTYAFAAGLVGGAIYSATLAYRDCHASVAKSALAGLFVLVVVIVLTGLLAALFATEPHWIRMVGSGAAFIVCSILCGFLPGRGPIPRPTRALPGAASAAPGGPVE